MENYRKVTKKIRIWVIALFAVWAAANLGIYIFKPDFTHLLITSLIFTLSLSTVLVLHGTMSLISRITMSSQTNKAQSKPTSPLVPEFLYIIIGMSLFIAAVLVETSGIKLIEEQPTQTATQIVLDTDQTEYKQKDIINITLANNSNNTIQYIDWNTNCQETAFTIGKKENNSYGFSPLTINKCMAVYVAELVTGDERTYSLDLNTWQTPPQTALGPGTYKFKFVYTQKDKDTEEVAYSNEFDIKKTADKGTSAHSVDSWKKYINEEVGFVIEIPTSWEPNVIQQATKTVVQFGKTSENLEITAGVYYNQDLQRELTFREVVEIHQPNNGQEAIDYELAGRSGKKYVYDIGASTKEVLIILPNPNKENSFFIITYYLRPDKQDPQEVTGRVLESLQFLDLTGPGNIKAAKAVLITYFDLLSTTKEYAEATKYHGSGYEILRTWNPNNNHAELLKQGCEVDGLKCLKIKEITSQEQLSPTKFIFGVQFANEDGTTFEKEPCCGATEKQQPPQTNFPYVVEKEGYRYLVRTAPLYMP